MSFKKNGFTFSFDIFIKNNATRYKPSLLIYLAAIFYWAYLYVYVFKAYETFIMYSIPFMQIVQTHDHYVTLYVCHSQFRPSHIALFWSSGVRALPVAAGTNEGGHYFW